MATGANIGQSNSRSDQGASARDGYIHAENAELYYREAGQGQPIIVLHGGPEFSHDYLLPDMDRLCYPSFRLIYYDQRGRGKSTSSATPEALSIQSEIDDLDALRNDFHFDSLALLGHSWGALLAMEYAIRHPDRVSHLILMNICPASYDDYMRFEQEFREKNYANAQELEALEHTPKYQEGDPKTYADGNRIFFRTTLRRPEHLERLIKNIMQGFTKQGILKSRKIAERLMDETCLSNGYSLLPKLKQISIPTLVIHGDYDFVPLACAGHIAEAIPGARFVLLKDTGHFAYIESPDEVRREIVELFRI